MEMNNGLVSLIVALLLFVGVFAGMAFSGGTEIVEVDKIIIQEKLIDKECAPCQCQGAILQEVENADNVLLNEFLESEFSEEYEEIEEAAEEYALEELEKKDFRVIENHIKSLILEGMLDEDSLDVDIDDVDVKVTMLGLDEDEDKSARVTFEVEVEYELEEGIVETHKKDLIVTYDVVFDEGDFNDEEVELISII